MKNYPEVIEIQFTNICNANCIICPYRSMNYKKEVMKDELFEKFIEDIKGKPLKRIIPYFNNEPFLDNTFISKLKRVREANPEAEVEISTNVVFFTEDKMREVLPLDITDIRLSVFGYERETYQKMMPTADYDTTFKHLRLISEIFKGSKTTISIIMIDNGEIDEQEFVNMENLAKELGFEFCRWGFLDRAGNVEKYSNDFYQENVIGCEQNRPTERMHILCNGQVVLCCQDWAASCICGDISKNTIAEVWNSAQYQEFRDCLFDKNKLAPEICRNCKLAIKGD